MRTESFEEAAALFRVLSSPVRIGALTSLIERTHTVTELAEAHNVSHSLMSQHLRVLRLAKLVRSTGTGRERSYAIADHHVTHIVRDALEHTEEGAEHD